MIDSMIRNSVNWGCRALVIPGVIDIVKSYSFSVEVEEPEPSLKQKIEEIEDGEYWLWGNYDL